MIQVSLTETAANKVKELIQRNDPDTGKPLGTPEGTYLRMYGAGGGCSGFRYRLPLRPSSRAGDGGVQVHGLSVRGHAKSQEPPAASPVDCPSRRAAAHG